MPARDRQTRHRGRPGTRSRAGAESAAALEARAMALLVSTLGARVMLPCPGCGTPTAADTTGRRRYCFPCSEADLGESLHAHRQRRELRMGRERYDQWRHETRVRARRLLLIGVFPY